eukprot:CAMPEP_0174344232 /NCGR_PEP_ID=MMETSP0810-20121108/27537_1 /TAXON_ID=73025 ORGANISM="Eutreptiella gymnastica-like, Strain CCMP1594" /NCGR_SAMPLE_ID=MMETSP0810 /ASSEMBLY_ACC=CAM_ASM_000659 /LENGTH=215 /DNA_ID=CAMNT_0015467325 /DNA_START=1360 /DNA_END=2008 /DNA_ORIENTATION=-
MGAVGGSVMPARLMPDPLGHVWNDCVANAAERVPRAGVLLSSPCLRQSGPAEPGRAEGASPVCRLCESDRDALWRQKDVRMLRAPGGRARAAAGSGAIAALSADVPRSAFLLVRVASPPAVGAAGLPELPGRPAHPLPSTGGGGLRIGCVRAPAYCLPCALHRGMSPDWAPYVGGWFATADLPRERGSPRPRGPCGCGQRALTPPACAPGPAPAV